MEMTQRISYSCEDNNGQSDLIINTITDKQGRILKQDITVMNNVLKSRNGNFMIGRK